MKIVFDNGQELELEIDQVVTGMVVSALLIFETDNLEDPDDAMVLTANTPGMTRITSLGLTGLVHHLLLSGNEGSE